jgi:hypothetical protein
MKQSLSIIGAAALSFLSAGLWASGQDKGGEILCAITNTVSCDAVGDCLKGPANAVNLPVFMNFHPDKKIVESAKGGGERRTSTITSVSNKEGFMVLVGDEEESAWSATINKSSGNLTGTITTDGVGFLIFGSCLAH